MRCRFTALGLCLGLFVWHVGQVEGQSRTVRNRPRSSQRVNPAHERAKQEADQAYQQGQFQRVIDLTASVLKQNPRDHVAYYLRGSARIELGRVQADLKLVRDGIADARQAIAFSETVDFNYYLPYLYGMTSLSAIENRNVHAEIAVKIAGQVLANPRLQPEEKANLLYQRALAHVSLKSFDAATGDYRQAIRLVPTHLGAYVGLADAYAAAGKRDQATEAFNRTAAKFPKNPLVYNNRGMFFQQAGKLDEAIVDFTRAIQLDENYFYAFTNRGFALSQQGNSRAAESDFSQSLRINANQPIVYSLRGSARLSRGKTANAIADYGNVVRLDPDNPVAHAEFGFAKFFAQDYAGARAELIQALKLDSNLQYLLPWQVLTLESLGQSKNARALAEDHLKQNVANKSWVNNQLKYLTGRLSEKELIDAARSSNQTTQNAQLCEAHFFIGWRKTSAGMTGAAATHYQQALKTNAKQLSAYRGAQYALKKFDVADTDETDKQN